MNAIDVSAIRSSSEEAMFPMVGDHLGNYTLACESVFLFSNSIFEGFIGEYNHFILMRSLYATTLPY